MSEERFAKFAMLVIGFCIGVILVLVIGVKPS